MTTEQKNRVTALRKAGIGYTKIAREVGISENTVKSYCRRNGLASAPAQPSENEPREKNCQMCGKPFMQYPGCREKKFCSAECRNKFWNIHIGDEKRKKMETYTCPNCGKTFYAYPGKLRKYCSHGCYIESRFGGAVCV